MEEVAAPPWLTSRQGEEKRARVKICKNEATASLLYQLLIWESTLVTLEPGCGIHQAGPPCCGHLSICIGGVASPAATVAIRWETRTPDLNTRRSHRRPSSTPFVHCKPAGARGTRKRRVEAPPKVTLPSSSNPQLHSFWSLFCSLYLRTSPPSGGSSLPHSAGARRPGAGEPRRAEAAAQHGGAERGSQCAQQRRGRGGVHACRPDRGGRDRTGWVGWVGWVGGVLGTSNG